MATAPKTKEELWHYPQTVITLTELSPLAELMTPDVICRFNNGPEVIGMQNGLQAFQSLLDGTEKLEQNVEACDISADGRIITSETTMVLRLRIDPSFTTYNIRGCFIFYLDTEGEKPGLVKRIHTYCDISEPLDRLAQLMASSSTST